MVAAARSALVVASVLHVPSFSSAAAAPPPGVRVPLEPVEGGWAVGAEIGGRRLHLLLDTGSSRSYVRREVAVSLDLRPRARFDIVDAAGTSVGLCAGPVPVRLGTHETSVECLSWRAEASRAEAGILPRGVDGILGADVFAGSRVFVDLADGSITIGGPELDSWVEGTEAVSGVVEGRLWIELRTASTRGGRARALRFVVDSGCDRALLFGAAAREQMGPAAGTAPSMRLVTLAGARSAPTAPLPELVSGDWRLRRARALLLPEVVDREEDGVLPLGDLGALYVDASAGRVVLGARLRTSPRETPTLLAAR